MFCLGAYGLLLRCGLFPRRLIALVLLLRLDGRRLGALLGSSLGLGIPQQGDRHAHVQLVYRLAVAGGEGAEAGMVVGARLDAVLRGESVSQVKISSVPWYVHGATKVRSGRGTPYSAIFGDVPHEEGRELEEREGDHGDGACPLSRTEREDDAGKEKDQARRWSWYRMQRTLTPIDRGKEKD